MSVKVYGLAAKDYVTSDATHTKDSNLGNGLNFGNGVILTASHLFSEITRDGGIFTADSQYLGVNQDQAKDDYGIPSERRGISTTRTPLRLRAPIWRSSTQVFRLTAAPSPLSPCSSIRLRPLNLNAMENAR